MIKGSHNTMSYLPVRQWWLRPFRAWGRCQNKDIKEQWQAGVRYFDLRIKFTSDGAARFGHGLIDYDTDSSVECSPTAIIADLLYRAVIVKEHVYIRILLEQKATDERIRMFKEWLASHVVPMFNVTSTAHIRIGTKEPWELWENDDTFDEPFVEVSKHYDVRWHFIVPPRGWLWEQGRIVGAVQQSGYDGIVAMDFV